MQLLSVCTIVMNQLLYAWVDKFLLKARALIHLYDYIFSWVEIWIYNQSKIPNNNFINSYFFKQIRVGIIGFYVNTIFRFWIGTCVRVCVGFLLLLLLVLLSIDHVYVFWCLSIQYIIYHIYWNILNYKGKENIRTGWDHIFIILMYYYHGVV